VAVNIENRVVSSGSSSAASSKASNGKESKASARGSEATPPPLLQDSLRTVQEVSVVDCLVEALTIFRSFLSPRCASPATVPSQSTTQIWSNLLQLQRAVQRKHAEEYRGKLPDELLRMDPGVSSLDSEASGASGGASLGALPVGGSGAGGLPGGSSGAGQKVAVLAAYRPEGDRIASDDLMRSERLAYESKHAAAAAARGSAGGTASARYQRQPSSPVAAKKGGRVVPLPPPTVLTQQADDEPVGDELLIELVRHLFDDAQLGIVSYPLSLVASCRTHRCGGCVVRSGASVAAERPFPALPLGPVVPAVHVLPARDGAGASRA
jgi:hypothetical protein